MNISSGIHHVTAIASDAQNNFDFYTKVLGLRLVKRTVNFDDPTNYHFYYGNKIGAPGTILTHFIWPGGVKTRAGRGEVNTTLLAVPEDSLEWWKNRFDRFGIAHDERENHGSSEVLAFEDPDGMRFEFVASESGEDENAWTQNGVAMENAIRFIHSVRLHVAQREPTAAVLTEHLGFQRGKTVEIVETPEAPRASGGVGSVHHVAFRTANDEAQNRFRADLVRHGFQVSPVMDRSYFHSIYFRESGGVLFEIATDGPGFATDESLETLGQALRLPPQYEAYRDSIEARLQVLK